MKKNLTIYAAILAITFSLATVNYAQLGGLINKAKDAIDKKKDKNKKEETKPNEATKPVESKTVSKDESKWEEGYFHSGIGQFLASTPWTAEFIIGKNHNYSAGHKFFPFSLIRREGEKGTMHYAKDYPELANLTEPYQPKINIEFSATPFSKGGVASNQFSSSGNIYGRLIAIKGNLQESLGLGNEGGKVSISLLIYRQDDIVALTNTGDIVLSAADAKKKEIEFDILPSVADAIYDPNAGIGSYSANEFQMANFNPNLFPTSGSYNVGVFATNNLLDEWGKETKEEVEHFGSFAYNFSVKDAAKIKTDREKLAKDFSNRREQEKEQEKIANEQEKIANQEVPKEWKLPSNRLLPIITDVKLRTMLMGLFDAKDRPELKILKSYASEPGATIWTIAYNDLGIPRLRYSNQTYKFFVKNIVSNRCFSLETFLRQDYAGAGTYGQTYLFLPREGQVFFTCDKLGLK